MISLFTKTYETSNTAYKMVLVMVFIYIINNILLFFAIYEQNVIALHASFSL